MNGVILINKPKGITSRDVVNEVCKILKTKKVGHTGTLDPIASGVLVVCVGKATKLVDIITSANKEYVATVKLGLLTDTLDLDGEVLKKEKVTIRKEELINVLNSFLGKYEQEVPIYSAVKVNGKKLYEYAREGKKVNLPKRMVEIKKIELINLTDEEYKFRVLVSKGTYIRSLIYDINRKLNVIGVMSDLVRTKQGIFNIDDAYTLEDIKTGNYKMYTITDVLKNDNCIVINDKLFNSIKNGCIIDNIYGKEVVTFIYDNKVVSIYKTYDKDKTKLKPFKMFI